MTPDDAHADLMRALLVERFSHPVPEYRMSVADREFAALRLVADNDADDEEVAG